MFLFTPDILLYRNLDPLTETVSFDFLTKSQIIDGWLCYSSLYHAIENTANQNEGKPLCVRQNTTQHSHEAFLVCIPENRRDMWDILQ